MKNGLWSCTTKIFTGPNLQIKISPHLEEINFLKIALKHWGVNEQEAKVMGTQWHFSREGRGEGGRDLWADCHQSALISHHGHESAAVTGSRAAAERGQAGSSLLLAPVLCSATPFHAQGPAWGIIHFPWSSRPCVSVSSARGSRALGLCWSLFRGSSACHTGYQHLSKWLPREELFNCTAAVIAAGCQKGFASTQVFKYGSGTKKLVWNSCLWGKNFSILLLCLCLLTHFNAKKNHSIGMH